MKKALIAASLAAALLVGGCAEMGAYFANPKNDIQIARTAFSAALTLFHAVCDNSAGAPFCSADNMLKAETLENAVQAALNVLDGVFTSDGKLAVSSDTLQADLDNFWKAEKAFSDFVNQLQADKTKAMMAKAVR